jgi:hypothetical protein
MLEVRQVGKFGKVRRSEKWGGWQVWKNRRLSDNFSTV